MKFIKMEKAENTSGKQTGKESPIPPIQNTLHLIEDILGSAMPERLELIEQFLSTSQ